MSSSPVWAEGLKKYGAYYEGYVEDLEGTLELHCQDTVTTWVIYANHRGNNPHLEKQTRKMNPKRSKVPVTISWSVYASNVWSISNT